MFSVWLTRCIAMCWHLRTSGHSIVEKKLYYRQITKQLNLLNLSVFQVLPFITELLILIFLYYTQFMFPCFPHTQSNEDSSSRITSTHLFVIIFKSLTNSFPKDLVHSFVSVSIRVHDI